VIFQSEFSFLRDADEVEQVFRAICKSLFSIEHGEFIYGGKMADIKQHRYTLQNM